jgi:transglutaminase-like putative cysteine protease
VTEKDRLTLAAVAATIAAGIALAPLTQDRTYLFLAAMILMATAGVATAARRLVRSERVVHLLHLLPILALGWLVPETRQPVTLAHDTYVFIQNGSAPMPFHTGFAVFCVLILWLVYLVAEALLTVANAPGWTFVPLFTPFMITAVFGYFEVNPVLFVLPAAGYGLLLATHARSSAVAEAERHGRGSLATQTWGRGIRRAGIAATVGAISLSLLTGLSLPASRPSTPGTGPGGVRFNDPSLDLIRNLNSTSNVPVITYRSTAEDGVMLRLAALPILDDSGFHPASPDLVAMPLPGTDVLGNTSVVTRVSVTDFASEYLPAPWVPTSVDVPASDWRWDQTTLAVLAVGKNPDEATRDLKYHVISAPVPSLDDVAASTESDGSGDTSMTTLSLPNGISAEATPLVTRLIEGRTTPGAKALAIRDYLRSDLFTYSTDRAPGSTLGTLNDFLFGSRTGYCEQFAGAMAVLARIARIPSRVVIGFRPGTKTDGTWQVTPRDMHAWAELYFDDLGWIPVDATPPGAFAARPTASPSASPTPTHHTAAPKSSASAVPTQQAPTAPAIGSGDPGALGIGAVALLGLALLGFAPGLVRQLQRLQRLSGRGEHPLEDAWDEVRASARDRGVRWPPGSTRTVAAALAPQLEGSARGQFVALALSTERERYAPQREPVGQVAAQVTAIRTGMEARWPASSSWLDRWWPRSLWPRGRSLRALLPGVNGRRRP